MAIEVVINAGVDEQSADATQADVLALFDELGPGLSRYLRSRGLPADAVDDIVQETFLALFRHLCLGRPRHNLPGWLFEVGRRLASKHLARVVRRRQREVPWTPIADAAIDPTGTPESQMLAEQRHVRLHRVIRALPARDRQCLLLRAEGLPYRDIARAVGLSLGGVAKALSRALVRIANSER